MRRFMMMTTAVIGLAAPAVWAEDAALILGNDSYERLGRVDRAGQVVDAADELRALGFDVQALRNGRMDAAVDALTEFADVAETADRIVVVLAGRFVTDGGQTWFLTSDADDPSYFGTPQTAVSVESVLQVLAQAPGQAVLMLGNDAVTGTMPYLSPSIGELDIPQGVTVLRGPVRDVAGYATDILVRPQYDLATGGDYNITALGYMPDTLVVMPMRPTAVPAPAAPETDNSAEVAMWEGARALDTVVAYRSYLRQYPNGEYRADAENLIAEIVNEPNRDARLAEESLSLSRDARREIQRDLSILDYNTRGIDGIFGSGTRSAITNWQQENGFSQTSYLTTDQIARLDAQAARRAAELEAEAERRRQEAEALDNTYWQETGAKGDEPGLRAYLDRYPDGIFAEVATERLEAIEAEKRRAAAAEEAAAWDRASNANTVGAYQDYLSVYPEGQFVGEAQAAIAELTQEEQIAPEVEAAQAAEANLALNALTRRLVELRLQQTGFEPGAVDGNFDEDTRRAIRRYQANAEIDGMGYLNEATLVRLLADAVNDIAQ
ncbi:hypothetical protein BVC71_08660 [Marivivens niveibacter]|uniref:Peptidoglycan binding-like domain-containing protein n=1 Tax=Marivivens niveibacter TaxID=1930667 RepID=A0A251WZZ9_9RHOB|nr:peptidoglycan-binding protein [Marivivens niveibacter]OUD09881.1 hypothetical protein BVC71_08660 [Marivivens niveibacter]